MNGEHMSGMRRIVAAAAVAVSASALAEGFTVAVWRGETTYADIPAQFASGVAARGAASASGVSVTPLRFDGVAYQVSAKDKTKAVRPDVCREWKNGDSGLPTMCRVSVQESASPGTVSFGPMEVRVLDRVLPPAKDWRYFLDLWQHPWAVSRYFGVEPFSPEHFEKMRPAWTALAECGCKALTVTLLERPWNGQCYDDYHSMIDRVKGDDGCWKFDYTVFDRYVEFGRKCGLGPDIACYTMCPWGYMVAWKNQRGEWQKAKALPGSPEFADFWGGFLVDFAKHLRQKGWFDDTYIAMDERAPDDVRAIVKFIQEKAPGMKVAMCGNKNPDLFKDISIDNFSIGLIHLKGDAGKEFLNTLESRRARGFKTTFYVCCTAAHPNTFMESPFDEGYWLGAYPPVAGFDGFLRWAASSWPKDPYRDATFKPKSWKAGDTYFVYPGGELSQRLMALRNGVVAAEKLRILRESGVDVESAGLADIRAKYGYRGACKNLIDFGAFRRDMDSLVNR